MKPAAALLSLSVTLSLSSSFPSPHLQIIFYHFYLPLKCQCVFLRLVEPRRFPHEFYMRVRLLFAEVSGGRKLQSVTLSVAFLPALNALLFV